MCIRDSTRPAEEGRRYGKKESGPMGFEAPDRRRIGGAGVWVKWACVARVRRVLGDGKSAGYEAAFTGLSLIHI